jgi:hypothetical protein
MPSGIRRTPRSGGRLRRRLKVTLKHSPSFTVDIGSGGFCAELLRVLPPGTPVEGTIQLRGGDLPFAGTVVWAKAGDAYLGLRGRMGVLFTRAPSEWSGLLGGGAAAA